MPCSAEKEFAVVSEGVGATFPLDGCDCQKLTSAPRAEIAEAKPCAAMKVRHSCRVAAVISSPDHEARMRVPSALNPGHEPKRAWYFWGHSQQKCVPTAAGPCGLH